MRVVKVLNNSLILALDDDGQEIILMGKGIGFHKAIGYEFRTSEIEKVFILKDRSISRNIIKLAAEVDQVYFELVEKIVEYAIDTYKLKLLEHIYLSLTDHLAFSIKRLENNILIPNFYTVEMKRFNPIEYDIGLFALDLIKKQLGYVLPDDEAGNIAFHFINAQFDHPYNDRNREINNTVNDILNIVKYYFNICYDEDSFSYSRFVIHLRFFVQRILNDTLLDEDSSKILYDNLTAKLENELKCVERILLYINKKFGIIFNESESVYLAIHINRVLNEI